MQKKDIGDFAKRSLYYTSKAYESQIDVAEKYLQLKKVYYIAIVDFEIFDNKNFISRHLIINQETTKQDLKDMEFTFVELKKFNLELSQCDTIVKKWIYFIQNASTFNMIPKEYENKLVYLMSVNKARFRNPVIPDCRLELNIEAIRSHGRVWKYKGEAFVDDKKMADAQWSATIVDKK